MLHLISNLQSGSRILDLGAGPGSFTTGRSDLTIVRLDLDRPERPGQGQYVAGNAARMPFADHSFHLIVSNHSLEHFLELEPALREMGRVLRPDGGIYVAVPDARTLTDRIYRWLGRGGGHVNPFRSPQELCGLIERLTGRPVRSSTVLVSSLSFLNSHNFHSRPPRKILLFANGNEYFLALVMGTLRLADRLLGTRFSQYGWAFRFGNTWNAVEPEVWVNVCVRCGSGHSESFLRSRGVVRRWSYRCPACSGFNFLSREQPGLRP